MFLLTQDRINDEKTTLNRSVTSIVGKIQEYKQLCGTAVLTRSTENSPSAKATGRSSGDHKQRLPDLLDLLDCLAQGKETR